MLTEKKRKLIFCFCLLGSDMSQILNLIENMANKNTMQNVYCIL